MKQIRNYLRLSKREMHVLKTTVFAMTFIVLSAGAALSIEVENDGHSYHNAEYKFVLLGGLRG